MAPRALLLLRLLTRRPPPLSVLSLLHPPPRLSSLAPPTSSPLVRRHFSWWSSPPLPPIPARFVPSDPSDAIGTFAAQPPAAQVLDQPADPPGCFASDDVDADGSERESAFMNAANNEPTWFLPADALIVTLDAVHNFLGTPWWLTIAGLAVFTRVLTLPLIIIQIQKVAQIMFILPKLPLPIPLPGSGKNMGDQYRLFAERRRELKCPSFAWFFATSITQGLLFMSSMIAIRRMAIEKYAGFECGGSLWFTDLTMPAHGSIGAIIPMLVAAAYFVNLQISFEGVEMKTSFLGVLMKFWKMWLNFSSLLIFAAGYYLPQACCMYWLPSNIWSLLQGWLLKQPRVRARLVRSESLVESGSSGPTEREASAKLPLYERLLLEAGDHVARNCHEEAIQLLESAIKVEPESPEAFGVLGNVHLSQQNWAKAVDCFGKAISKGNTTELLIAAYTGCGIALFNQGKMAESIAALRMVRSFKVPQNPLTRYAYHNALIVLRSALRQQGFQNEAMEVYEEVSELEAAARDAEKQQKSK